MLGCLFFLLVAVALGEKRLVPGLHPLLRERARKNDALRLSDVAEVQSQLLKEDPLLLLKEAVKALKKTNDRQLIGGFVDDVDDGDCAAYAHSDCYAMGENPFPNDDDLKNSALYYALQVAATMGVNSCERCGYALAADDVQSPFDCISCFPGFELLVVYEDCSGICVDPTAVPFLKTLGLATLEDSACDQFPRPCFANDDVVANLPATGSNLNFVPLESDFFLCYGYGRVYCENGSVHVADCDMKDCSSCPEAIDLGLAEIGCQDGYGASFKCNPQVLTIATCGPQPSIQNYGVDGLCYPTGDDCDGISSGSYSYDYDGPFVRYYCETNGDVMIGYDCERRCQTCETTVKVVDDPTLDDLLSCHSETIDLSFGCYDKDLLVTNCNTGNSVEFPDGLCEPDPPLMSYSYEIIIEEETPPTQQFYPSRAPIFKPTAAPYPFAFDYCDSNREFFSCEAGRVVYGSDCTANCHYCASTRPAFSVPVVNSLLNCDNPQTKYAFACSSDDILFAMECATGHFFTDTSNPDFFCDCGFALADTTYSFSFGELLPDVNDLQNCPAPALERYDLINGDLMLGTNCRDCDLSFCSDIHKVKGTPVIESILGCETSIFGLAYGCDGNDVVATYCDSGKTFYETSDSRLGCKCTMPEAAIAPAAAPTGGPEEVDLSPCADVAFLAANNAYYVECDGAVYCDSSISNNSPNCMDVPFLSSGQCHSAYDLRICGDGGVVKDRLGTNDPEEACGSHPDTMEELARSCCLNSKSVCETLLDYYPSEDDATKDPICDASYCADSGSCCAPLSRNMVARCNNDFLPVRTGEACGGFVEGAFTCCDPEAMPEAVDVVCDCSCYWNGYACGIFDADPRCNPKVCGLSVGPYCFDGSEGGCDDRGCSFSGDEAGPCCDVTKTVFTNNDHCNPDLRVRFESTFVVDGMSADEARAYHVVFAEALASLSGLGSVAAIDVDFEEKRSGRRLQAATYEERAMVSYSVTCVEAAAAAMTAAMRDLSASDIVSALQNAARARGSDVFAFIIVSEIDGVSQLSSPTSKNSSGPDDATGAIVGITIAVIVVCALLAVLARTFFLKKQHLSFRQIGSSASFEVFGVELSKRTAYANTPQSPPNVLNTFHLNGVEDPI